MTKSHFPPQAFTKAELTKAFQWLQQQPETVRNQVGSSDALMTMYRRSQVYGSLNPASEAPVSEKKFKSELKDLAVQMGSFDSTKEPNEELSKKKYIEAPPSHATPPTTSNFNMETSSYTPPPTVNYSPAANQSFIDPGATENLFELDGLSKQRLEELKHQLNLGSEKEVLRLAITVAYHRLKQLL